MRMRIWYWLLFDHIQSVCTLFVILALVFSYNCRKDCSSCNCSVFSVALPLLRLFWWPLFFQISPYLLKYWKRRFVRIEWFFIGWFSNSRYLLKRCFWLSEYDPNLICNRCVYHVFPIWKQHLFIYVTML
jgi:hypothetical protein